MRFRRLCVFDTKPFFSFRHIFKLLNRDIRAKLDVTSPFKVAKPVDHMSRVLKKISLFSGLTQAELESLARIATERTYRKHTFVFMEGEQRDAVFFIEAGVVKVFKIDEEGNEQIISLLKKGDMFPHVGFFDNVPYPGTAEVVQDCRLLVIHVNDFNELLMDNPRIAIQVMKVMEQKIIELQQRLQALLSGDVFRKVVHLLLRLAAEYGEKRADGVFIAVPMTNRDFANMVGTSRESVNRTLNQLKKDKLLDIDRQGILIYDLEALKEHHL